jgi:hypothetical protein
MIQGSNMIYHHKGVYSIKRDQPYLNALFSYLLRVAGSYNEETFHQTRCLRVLRDAVASQRERALVIAKETWVALLYLIIVDR